MANFWWRSLRRTMDGCLLTRPSPSRWCTPWHVAVVRMPCGVELVSWWMRGHLPREGDRRLPWAVSRNRRILQGRSSVKALLVVHRFWWNWRHAIPMPVRWRRSRRSWMPCSSWWWRTLWTPRRLACHRRSSPIPWSSSSSRTPCWWPLAGWECNVWARWSPHCVGGSVGHWNCHAVWGALPRSTWPCSFAWGTDSCSVDVACDGMVCHEDGPAVPDHPLSGPSIPDAWAYPFWCSSLWAGTMGTRELGHDGQSRPGLIPFGFGIYDSECRVMYTVWTHAAEQPGTMWPWLPRISMFSGEGSPPRSPACLLVGYPRGLLARLEFDCNPPGLLCQRALAELWLPVAGTSPHQRRSLGDHGHDPIRCESGDVSCPLLGTSSWSSAGDEGGAERCPDSWIQSVAALSPDPWECAGSGPGLYANEPPLQWPEDAAVRPSEERPHEEILSAFSHQETGVGVVCEQPAPHWCMGLGGTGSFECIG